MNKFYYNDDEILQRIMDFITDLEHDYSCEIMYNVDEIKFVKHAKK